MIIIDKPYISDFLKETLSEHQLPVLKTDIAAEMLGEGSFNYVEPMSLVNSYENDSPTPIYTPSENALHWISKNLKTSLLQEKIHYFKNKVAFRKLLSDIYPAFRFKEIPYNELDTVNPSELFFPMILKPSVGFFSMGVRKVNSSKDWPTVVEAIKKELEQLKNIYPDAVLDTTSFIAEEIIEGEEYAIDAYFDDKGSPVLLGMMKHIFGSDEDVSDRVYFTSGELIQQK
ncbi:MAG TPA: ATP-grasp domain-containing protein, partial [Bacteroidales bacterium]|nr:ATP-grasp domain-containing protein [Bacteroidales bacterium]